MNEIMNKFLLAGDKFMPVMHLRQPAALKKPGLTYGASGPFTKTKKRIHKSKENENQIQNILIKTTYIKLIFNIK